MTSKVDQFIQVNLPNLKKETTRKTTSLCQLLHYQQDSSSGLNAVRSEIKNLWAKRNVSSHKENCPVICTFGVKGQGKTELCLQAIIADDLAMDLEDVDDIVTLHATFHQGCTYSESESRALSIEDSLLWRLMNCLDVAEGGAMTMKQFLSLKEETDFQSFCMKIRNITSNKNKRVGLLFMVDEILKITDLVKRRELLNFCASNQQRDLSMGFPTFFVITSLNYRPVHQELKTNSGRKIRLVPLPILSDQSLDGHVRSISSKLEQLAGIDPTNEALKHHIHSFVSIVVHTSGKHFRTLETMLGILYSAIIPFSRHKKFTNSSNSEWGWIESFTPNRELEKLDLDAFNEKLSSSFLENCFQAGCSEILESEDCDYLFSSAFSIFLKLIIDPDTFFNEKDLISLEVCGAAFVKSRNIWNFSKINPRINLPFLYSYCCSNYRAKQQELCDLNTYSLQILSKIVEVINTFHHIKTSKLDRVFEETIIWIELVRINAIYRDDIRHISQRVISVMSVLSVGWLVILLFWKQSVVALIITLLLLMYMVNKDSIENKMWDAAIENTRQSPYLLGFRKSMVRIYNWIFSGVGVFLSLISFLPWPKRYYSTCSIDDILPDLIMKNWENEKLIPAQFLKGYFRCEYSLPDSKQIFTSRQNSIEAIKLAKTAREQMVYVKQSSSRDTEGLEYVSRHFSSTENPGDSVLFLCSMKLRQANTRELKNIEQLAKDLHSFAREAGLRDREYYCVFYCSAPSSMFSREHLPKGTIIIPVETLQSILKPFGMSFLLSVIEEKAKTKRNEKK